MSAIFTGCAAALVTPMALDGSLDERALERLLDLQLAAHMDAVVVLGTTGEPCTLSMDERARVISAAVSACKGRMPVIVGTGSNDTRLAMAYARQAKALGADAQLTVTPYYNKATQEGLIRHYNAILGVCPLPMLLYDVPARTGLRLEPETCAQLAVHPLIAGLKDASGDPRAISRVRALTGGTLPVYSGEDETTVQAMAAGACGAISVLANVVPERARRVTAMCLSGDFAAARKEHEALLPLTRALFSQVSPIPVKAALSMLGLCEDALRLPLTPLEEPHRARLSEVLRRLKLLS